MSKHNALIKIVLLGRVNVGKSTLFNRLSSKLKALVYDYEGVTRDPLYDVCSWKDLNFTIVDTAGFDFGKEKGDVIYQETIKKSFSEIETGDVLVLVVDGDTGLSSEDYKLIEGLRKKGNNFIVAINKSDIKDSIHTLYQVQGLGIEQVVLISAAHARGIEDLLNMIYDLSLITPTKKNIEPKESKFTICFLGKPNVGKSSLMNALLKEDRSVISDIPGTTRESIFSEVEYCKETIGVIDTAGVRRKRKVEEDLEKMMVSSTMEALKKADIVLLLIDTMAGEICDQDIKLAFFAFDSLFKSVIVVWNKIDLVEDAENKIRKMSEEYDFFLRKLRHIHISCKTGKNIGKIIPICSEIYQLYSTKFNDEEVHSLFALALARTPLVKNKIILLLKKVNQIASNPPTLFVKVSHPELFEESQINFFENLLRAKYDLTSVPVKFLIQKRKKIHKS